MINFIDRLYMKLAVLLAKWVNPDPINRNRPND